MTAVTTAAPGRTRSLTQVDQNGRSRRRTDRVARGVLLAGMVVAVVPLFLILFTVIREGLPAMTLEFLTTSQPFSFRREGGGYLNGAFGTVYIVSIATLLSVPLGIMGAVYLTEYNTHPLVGPTRFFTDVMTGVPSIFVGLFVYVALVLPGLGVGTFVGGVALAILMLPIVVRSGEEIIKAIPQDIRQGAYALGARRWQVVTRVVLPAAGPGLITGSMLAVARAAGETAPLLLVIFGAFELTTAFQGQAQSALPLIIFDEIRQPFQAAQTRAFAGALELILFVLLLTVVARLIGRRARR